MTQVAVNYYSEDPVQMRISKLSNWFQSYKNRLEKFIHSQVRSIEEAEDIAQDVWYQLSRQEDLEGIKEVGAWLFGVARNRVYNLYKKKKNTVFSDIIENDDDTNEEPTFQDWVSDHFTDEYTYKKEFRFHLENALQLLPVEQRMAFIQHEMEGYSFDEISKETGIAVNTLISRKRYAVQGLRKYFMNVESI